MNRWALALPSTLILAATLAAPLRAVESPADFAKRTAWWRDARFGMFIHWGLYAVPADATDTQGRKVLAEWYFSNKQMQMKDYVKIAPRFNPVRFDAKRWVRLAKLAGMKYIVITSKHHDGFCLFGSKLTDWNIAHATPYGRDPVAQLAAECKRQGIKLCFYYSIMDWNHPDYLPRRPWEKGVRPETGADFSRYLVYLKGQLRELVTRYDPAVLWFDGEWEATWNHDLGKDLYAYVRSLKPSILINNRVDKGRQGMQGMNASAEFMGDFGTPEQEVPPAGFDDGRLWETCMTMNDTWGYAKNDQNWKSEETLVRTLIDVAHKGGNFLLNVGPTELGEFPAAIDQRLIGMGRWMAKHSDSIYGSSQSPFKSLPFEGRCTAKGDRLFLHVFTWPADGLRVDGLKAAVRGARAVGSGEKLSATRAAGNEGTVYFSRPATLDPISTVVELRLDRKGSDAAK